MNLSSDHASCGEKDSRRTLLICDHTAEDALHVDGSLPSAECHLHASLIAAALDFTGLDVVLHRGQGGTGSASSDTAVSALCAASGGRARIVTDIPLRALLPATEILVSFASLALMEGGWCGLKPVQIGRFFRGSAAFSHIFDGPQSFVRAFQAGAVTGTMTLAEYTEFERFCRDLAARCPSGRDSLQSACRRPGPVPLSFARTIVSAMANPFAVMRLLHSQFHAAPSTNAGRHTRISRNPLVAGGGNEQTR